MTKISDHYKSEVKHAATFTLEPVAVTPPPAPIPAVNENEPRHWIWDIVILMTGGFLSTLFWVIVLVIESM